MPRSLTVVTIFLASPLDVDHERDLVAKTIQEWNEINSRHKAIYLELLRFETSVSAGFGDDGQDVINEQIADQYDLLIALFWKRLGSATPRARSGTIEEYERALSRYKKDEQIDLAFFFKDAPIDPRRDDLSQVQAVQEFEKEVQSAGALTKTFQDDDALRFELNLLFDRVARKTSKGDSGDIQSTPKGGSPPSAIAKTRSENDLKANSDDDEPGLFDVVEDMTVHAQGATGFLTKMSAELELMTGVTNQVSSRLEEMKKLRPVGPSETRPLLLEVSAAMDTYSDFIENEFPEYSENSSELVDDIRKMIDISYDSLSDDNRELLDNVVGFRSTIVEMMTNMANARNAYRSMLDAIKGMQRMTSSLNKAKKRIIYNNSLVVDRMESDLGVLNQALMEIDRLIGIAETGTSALADPKSD